jgi:ATP-dependent DNA helicase RecQ
VSRGAASGGAASGGAASGLGASLVSGSAAGSAAAPARGASLAVRDTPTPARGEGASVDAVFERLRGWRAATAKAQAVPAYVVFRDVTLRQIAAERPGTLAGLAAVSGVGQGKAAKFGDEVLAVLAEFDSGATLVPAPRATSASSAPAARSATPDRAPAPGRSPAAARTAAPTSARAVSSPARPTGSVFDESPLFDDEEPPYDYEP